MRLTLLLAMLCLAGCEPHCSDSVTFLGDGHYHEAQCSDWRQKLSLETIGGQLIAKCTCPTGDAGR